MSFIFAITTITSKILSKKRAWVKYSLFPSAQTQHSIYNLANAQHHMNGNKYENKWSWCTNNEHLNLYCLWFSAGKPTPQTRDWTRRWWLMSLSAAAIHWLFVQTLMRRACDRCIWIVLSIFTSCVAWLKQHRQTRSTILLCNSLQWETLHRNKSMCLTI